MADATTGAAVNAEPTEGRLGLKDQPDIYVRAWEGYRRRTAWDLAERFGLDGLRSTAAIGSVGHVGSAYVCRTLLELWDDFFG